MRGDVRGVGNPLDAPKDLSADKCNLSALFETSQMVIVCLIYYLPQLPHLAPGVLEARSLASLAHSKLDLWTQSGERYSANWRRIQE